MVVCELIFSNYAFIIYNKKIPDLDYDAVDGNTVLSEFLQLANVQIVILLELLTKFVKVRMIFMRSTRKL